MANVVFGFVSCLFLLLFGYLEWMKTNVMNKRKEISNTQENSYLWLKIQVWIFFIDFEIVFFFVEIDRNQIDIAF